MRVNMTVTTLTENDGDAVNVIDTTIYMEYKGDGKVRVYDSANSTLIFDAVGADAIRMVEKLYAYMNDTIGT